MKQSNIFIKALRSWPKDEQSINARYLIRGGFVNKSSSGIYTFLPLGLRVLRKINNIIRTELNSMGALELLMPVLISRKYWDATNRWDTDVMYRVEDSSGQEYGLSFTHEEVLTPILKNFISSWRDLPVALYQIQTKFRDEPRARSGLLRSKEFPMNDLYSFHQDKEDFEKYYWKVAETYKAIFAGLNLPVVVTKAAGGTFTEDYTHEFQVVAPSGEDTILVCLKCGFAENNEIAKIKAGQACPSCKKGKIQQEKSIEVGNIFPLGTKYSHPVNLSFKTKEGKEAPVIMGSYGIGTSRVMAALVELYHDENGIIWPESIAPYGVHIIELEGGQEMAQMAYEGLSKEGIEILHDDRNDLRAGEKLAEADLIGIPWRIIASKKNSELQKLELKNRREVSSELLTLDEVITKIKKT